MVSPQTDGLSAEQLTQFRVLQQRFVAGLPVRWLEIQNAQTPLARQAALHRLSGSAGGYGFECLRQRAQEAELLLPGDDGNAWANAVALLRVEIELACTTLQAYTLSVPD